MPDPKPTLEELLQVKRAERPQPQFWDRFERELHEKTLRTLTAPEETTFSRWARLLRPALATGGAAAALLFAVGVWSLSEMPAPQEPSFPATVSASAAPVAPPSPMVAEAREPASARAEFGVTVLESRTSSTFAREMNPEAYSAGPGISTAYRPETLDRSGRPSGISFASF